MSDATELREAMMALARQLRRHRPDNGLTMSQLELLGDVSRAGVTTPAEVAGRLQVRVQSLTDSLNELEARGLVSRRPDDTDRRRQLIELTPTAWNCCGVTAPSGTAGCPRPCANTSPSWSATC